MNASRPQPLADPGPPLHLVAVRTATGAVTFFATRRPTEQLIHLGRELVVERRLVMQTRHAERLVQELQSEFADTQTANDGRPFFLADWESAVDAIAQFDLATGQRMEREGVKVGDTVQVELGLADSPSKLRGYVRGINGKRYLVEIPNGPTGLFTRNLVKPIVRVPALGAAA